MSTIRNVIERVNALKVHPFTEEQQLRWISLLEGKLAADVFLMSIGDIRALEYRYPESMDTELLVTHPHDDIYDHWLMAQIDMANGEYDKYQNTMLMYNASLDSFTAWFAQLYDPAQGYIRED